MPFQFYCPQGHLLEGHESQMGQQSQCPLCGAVFLIPILPQSAPPAAAANPLHDLEAAPPPPAPAPEPPPPAAQEPPPPEPPKVEEPIQPRVFRIACPKGHILETPSDMVGQQALCPYCNTQFELRYEDSVEYHEEQAAAKLRREQHINRLWVKWSIGAVIVVLVMFLGMIVYVTWIRPMNETGG